MSRDQDGSYATESNLAIHHPRGLKARARAGLRHGVLSLLGRLMPLDRGPSLRLLYCHYVFDDQIEAFRRLMVTLSGWGKFVDTDTCVSMIQGTSVIDGRCFHLSFDDGFRNVVRSAVSILEELGMPAISFVPTSIGGASWGTVRRHCLETTRYSGVIEPVTWDDLDDVASRGFDVGSHTKSHARLSESGTGRALEDEIWGSKREIEKHSKTACKYISWPLGARTGFDGRSIATAHQAGYTACFAAFRGSIVPDAAADPFVIPRHHIEVQWPLSHIRYFAAGHGED